ncbi:MAG: PilT/PilU family type 4a pilus ATPase [Clostridia bacterium]|nr:PilT/PilU family type 4a pilus ATPase [Clostridia bacterium]
MTFLDIYNTVKQFDASDIHLNVGYKPAVRIYGDIVYLDEFPVITDRIMRLIVDEVMMGRVSIKLLYDANGETDFSYYVDEQRFRVNLYRVMGSPSLTFRIIKKDAVPAEVLGIDGIAGKIASLEKGLVVVTGPTGSGKSTTLASIVEYINQRKPLKVITIEDPVEFKFTPRKCIINQREVGPDTKNFANALRGALREDPDIILVGELRDAETINVALTAVETGHLVLSTLHTQSAAQTISRIIDVFPTEEQNRVRSQLSLSLKVSMSQRLVKTCDKPGRALCEEVLVVDNEVAQLISEGNISEIMKRMQKMDDGYTKTMDKTLATLFKNKRIDLNEVLRYVSDKKYTEELING